MLVLIVTSALAALSIAAALTPLPPQTVAEQIDTGLISLAEVRRLIGTTTTALEDAMALTLEDFTALLQRNGTAPPDASRAGETRRRQPPRQ